MPIKRLMITYGRDSGISLTRITMFEKYQENRLQKNLKFQIVEATHSHIRGAAKISLERQGSGDILQICKELENFSGIKDARLFVAVANKEIAGFAKARKFVGEAYSHEGWYLCGVVVKPEYRGSGIGRELTRVRLDYIESVARKVYYFANVKNAVSIKLHESFGFKKLTESFKFPDVTFSGGIGCLFKIEANGLQK